MSLIKQEADRCLKCKNARCAANCPVSTPVPQIVELFLNGEMKKAGEILFNNNPLSFHLRCNLVAKPMLKRGKNPVSSSCNRRTDGGGTKEQRRNDEGTTGAGRRKEATDTPRPKIGCLFMKPDSLF